MRLTAKAPQLPNGHVVIEAISCLLHTDTIMKRRCRHRSARTKSLTHRARFDIRVHQNSLVRTGGRGARAPQQSWTGRMDDLASSAGAVEPFGAPPEPLLPGDLTLLPSGGAGVGR